MTSPLVTQLDQALQATGNLVDGVGDVDWDARTPCTDWDVTALVRHLVVGNDLFATLLRGERPEAGGEAPAGEAALHLAAAFRPSAAGLVAAFDQPGALERVVTVPVGTVPGAVAAHLRLVEALVHGWDLARATGQGTTFDDEVVLQELEFSRAAVAQIPPGRRPFGPPHDVAADAPPLDQLAALLGRAVG